jgi:hypothetical protein
VGHRYPGREQRQAVDVAGEIHGRAVLVVWIAGVVGLQFS